MDDKKTFKNEGIIKINRDVVNTDNTVATSEISVGRYYFEGTRGIKQCTLQLFLEQEITLASEKEQIEKIYSEKYLEFANDSNLFGWNDILTIKEPTTTV